MIQRKQGKKFAYLAPEMQPILEETYGIIVYQDQVMQLVQALAGFSLGKAHEIADGLEAALGAELGVEVEIETHIEPLQMRGLSGRDAPNERVAAVRDALNAIAANIAFVGQVHDVRVRETADGEIVNFHCRVDPQLTVRDVHERVDDVERALRQKFPTIKRVIGHAEPRA